MNYNSNDDCTPIVFSFQILYRSLQRVNAFPPIIYVKIPFDKKYSIQWAFFYKSISNQINVPENKIIIDGLSLSMIEIGRKSKLMCPIAYALSGTTNFFVSIVE